MNLLDTLRRRGEADETVVNNAFYSANANDERIAGYAARVARINVLEDTIEELEDDALIAKTAEFRQRLRDGATEEDLLEEAFAVVREAAWRTLELRHYDVQIQGALALSAGGTLAQMGTGEGKTLVATCAVYLNALSGKGSYVVTVNDYLARRDAEQMGQVYSFLGLSVGLVQAGMAPAERRAAYACDVTYVTNSELGFDYLRDHLAMTEAETVLRPEGFNFAVVDEGDSVLVDEARVPLIISGSTDAPVAKYQAAAKLAATMVPEKHYTANEKELAASLTEEGTTYAETALQVKDLFDPANPWALYVVNAIRAKDLLVKDKSYIVQDGEAKIVDEFSGRVLDGRRWGGGLHQSVEAKEQLEVQPETETIASVTYQALFRLFPKLSAMSGTALTEAEEFATFYDLQVVCIPPALPRQRVDLPAAVYKTVKGKSNAALDELLGMHQSGRPVLVGTTSVEASQAFADKLTSIGIKHEVLNAKPESIAREAEIIAQAGRRVTAKSLKEMALSKSLVR
jgi:preprotein translocase subunit SecA